MRPQVESIEGKYSEKAISVDRTNYFHYSYIFL